MSKVQSSTLENLIHKLTKAEKRYFKLIIQKSKATNESMFYQLFQLIERDGKLDKSKALRTIDGLKASQISNIKKQVYNHILDALRAFHKNNSIELSLRAEIDNGKLLYNKALYHQSLKVLHKAKYKAIKYNLYNIALEIVEFEKYIESQHITNANAFRAKELVRESELIKVIVDRINDNLNLSLSLYDLYLKLGFAKDESKYEYIKAYFEKKIPHQPDFESMVFFEKLYLIQAYVWYNYMIQNFTQYYKYTMYWVELFRDNSLMINLRPTLYLKGLHNLLTGQYNVYLFDNYIETLDELTYIEKIYNLKSNQNLVSTKMLYYYMHRLDLFFWEGEFEQGSQFVKELGIVLDKKVYPWDIYRELNFYFKIASMYFGNGEYSVAIKYLNKILNHKQLKVHSELYAYAMILQAMAQYEAGNTVHLDYFIKSIHRHLKLKENLQLVESEILSFVRKVPFLTMDNYMNSFIRFRERLELLRDNNYERRAFWFLDIISWLDSKIEKRPLAEVIKDKFRKR